MDLDGRVGGGALKEAGEGATVIRIYYMKKYFLTKEKINLMNLLLHKRWSRKKLRKNLEL